ncbi:MAG: hypothetical protein ABI888_03260 [Chloroflexota bacterium]
MTSKYRPWVFVLAAVMAACAPQAIAPSATPSAPTASPSPVRPSDAPGLPAAIPAKVTADRRWYTVPNGLDNAPVKVTATFDADATNGAPFVNVDGSPDIPLVRTGGFWSTTVPLDGLTPGEHTISLYERLAGSPRVLQRVAGTTFLLSQPEYVVWTLDFEGDASGDAELANTAAVADGLKIPMAVFWNPRVWTTTQVSPERQAAMLKWTMDRRAKGDEVALHLHMWTDYVRAAGIAPLTAPSWAGRGDGYDVPINAYPEGAQQTLITYGVQLMLDHGFAKPTSFRAGGDMADAATLRAAASTGFDLDCTAVAKDYPSIGRIPYPWNLPVGAQPYYPDPNNANVPGSLPLLEAPTIGGNTYAFTVNSIQPQIRANLALFAPAGTVATLRKTITVVSHPGTIVPAERAAIEALLGAFDALRYDKDAGPVRFVTAAQLAKAYR